MRKKKIKIKDIFSKIKFQNNFIINDVKPLDLAKKNDITFFDSIKYLSIAKKPKGVYVLHHQNLKDFLPSK